MKIITYSSTNELVSKSRTKTKTKTEIRDDNWNDPFWCKGFIDHEEEE